MISKKQSNEHRLPTRPDWTSNGPTSNWPGSRAQTPNARSCGAIQSLRHASAPLPDIMTSVDDASQPYWDFVVNLEGRQIAFDVRTRTSPYLERTDDPKNYDPSILQLANSDADYLAFVFVGGVSGEKLLAHLENRSKRLSGRLKYIVVVNEAEMDMVLRRFLENLFAPRQSGYSS